MQPCRIIQGVPRSPEWDTVRKKWLKENPRCVVCDRTTKLNVHHIKPYHLYPELELDLTNFVTLCENTGINCHFIFGHLGDWIAYNPTITEDSKQMNDKIKNRPYNKEEYGGRVA